MYSSTTIHIKNLSADDVKTLNKLSSMIAELYNNCINFIKSNYENNNYNELIDKYKDSNKVIVMTTQVPNEGSDIAIYQVGHQLKKKANILVKVHQS